MRGDVLRGSATRAGTAGARRPLLRVAARLHARALTAGRERGDMPGWVLITVMTAGIVVVLWQLAGDQLKQMLQSALNRVTGPGGP